MPTLHQLLSKDTKAKAQKRLVVFNYPYHILSTLGRMLFSKQQTTTTSNVFIQSTPAEYFNPLNSLSPQTKLWSFPAFLGLHVTTLAVDLKNSRKSEA